MTNPWDKIFVDDFTSAYVIADYNYLKTSQDFDLRARAICSLLLQKYDNALADFLLLNENEKKTGRISDGTYLDIALCYYAMGDIDRAIDYFNFPITNSKDIKYTSDIARPACILFYVANKLNRPDLMKIATKGLGRRKLEVPLFLLGQVSTTVLNKIYEQQTNKILHNRYHCKIEFYKAAAELANGNFEKHQEHLDNCVRLKGQYLEFEYYIAKVEQDKLNRR